MGDSRGTGLPAPEQSDRRRAAVQAGIVGLLMATVVLATVAGTWSTATNSARASYQEHLITLARASAQGIDSSLHKLIRQPGQIDGFLYRRAVEPLRRMRRAVPEIRYLYTIVRDDQKVRIILDAADPGDNDHDGVEDRSTIGEVSHSPQVAKLHALGLRGDRPRPAATDVPYTDAWGTFMSGYAPFYDVNGQLVGAVGVDVDATAYVAELREARRRIVLGMLPAGALILLLTFAMYRARLRGLVAAREVERAAQRAEQAARRDRLTGLANRTALVERLEATYERQQRDPQCGFAVMFLDFDYFKVVNDTLGHEAGDELLRQIAGRLRAALRAEDAAGSRGNVVARFGGDEFVVLIDELRHEGDVAAVANGLLGALAPPYTIGGHEVKSSASIGVCTGRHAPSADAILRNADVAMYEAKQSGRGCYVLFDTAMQARLTRQVKLSSHLLNAVGSAELTLGYQPIVELESGRLVGAEALPHWRHPELGEIGRAELMAVAEESGLVSQIGEWSLRQACRDLAEWRDATPETAPQFVTVNLSRHELALGSRLHERIRGALAAARLPPECLLLEIPERVATDTRAGPRGTLEGLRSVGVRLSLDGFGCGSSSPASLGGHLFDSIKLAQGSVRGLASSRDAMALAHATITLVENLGMSSTAEGVEDAAQLAVLQSLGCRYAQGPFFSEPVTADRLLATWPRPGLDSSRAA